MNKRAIELPEHLEAQVESLAETTGRTHEQIIADAVEIYLLGRSQWHRDMDGALSDVNAGIGYDGEDVLDWMESWGTESEKPEPRRLTRRS